jgi:PEP-CTERM motif
VNVKSALTAVALAAAAMSASATTTVGGISFADNAFADALYYSSGNFTTSGGSLSQVLTDKDAGTYAFSFSAGASVMLGFTDNNVFNGSGADLAIFELGIPDTVTVSLAGQTKSFQTVATGFSAGGYSLNVALVDFSDFGIVAGANLTYQQIGLDTNIGTVPSLSLVGALHVNAVPEPETYAMLLAGMGVVATIARRRKIA